MLSGTRLWDRVKSPGGAAVMAIVALISGTVIGLWGLFAERQPALQFTTVSMSRVFDLHQPVGGLVITYGGQDLREAKKALWSISIDLTNTGSASIRKADFDERLPLSIEVSDATIVDTATVKASIDYLNKTVRLRQQDSRLLFEPFILDPQDSLRISFLALGQDGIRPALSISGKLAGIRSIESVQLDTQDTEHSAWKRIFGADAWWIHPLRGVFYFVMSMAVLLGLAFMIFAWAELLQKAKNKELSRRRADYLKSLRIKARLPDEPREAICNVYITHGKAGVSQLIRLKRVFDARTNLHSSLTSPSLSDDELKVLVRRRFPSYPLDRQVYREVLNRGVIRESRHGTEFSADSAYFIDELAAALRVRSAKHLNALDSFWENVDKHLAATRIADD
jgi:hypothetical protein